MKYFTAFLLIISSLCISIQTDAGQKNHRAPYIIIPSESVSYYENHCFKEINRVRQEYGLKPLIWWSELSDCAREHCQNMADGKCEVGHDGFEERFKSMQKIARLKFFGENVAYCYNYKNPVAISVEGWMESEGHRENILDDFQETGIGVAISKEGKFYITQLFAKRIPLRKKR